MTTSACEAGKIDEAKASLKGYLDLLNDVNQEPSKNVKELAKKIDISLKSYPTDQKNKDIDEVKPVSNLNQEPILQDLPEQANYSNVMDGLVKSLEEKTGLHVSILNKKDNSGKIYFEYKDLEQLNFITKLIKSDN